jgi:diadenosine tetraphosphatase ApaH/serine/threonine PP2A family protein phosphatase
VTCAVRYAIISDIHSNIEALSRVFEKIDELAPDQILCLGDLVGYYAHPNECIDLILERNVTCIMGNHDVVACGKVEPTHFNPAAAQAILWTRDQLTRDHIKFLSALPDSKKIDDNLLMVHGSVADRDQYLLFRPEIEQSFRLLRQLDELPTIAFFGHTHRRIFYEHDGKNLFSSKADRFERVENTAYIVNPGSVGQPRDLDPRAAFCLFDSEKGEVEFFRVEYDIEATAEKAAELPFGEGLARRLFKGV